MLTISSLYLATVEPPKKGHFESGAFVRFSEVREVATL